MLLDPFMGSGSTLAAARAVGYASIGIELDAAFFRLAEKAIPRLAALYRDFKGEELEMETGYGPVPKEDEKQLSMALAETTVPGAAKTRNPPPGGQARNSRARHR